MNLHPNFTANANRPLHKAAHGFHRNTGETDLSVAPHALLDSKAKLIETDGSASEPSI